MNCRDSLGLFATGFMVTAAIGLCQPAPGYMDADYYLMGGSRLVQGYGFTEPILWNYLDEPGGLPHPSFAYWMPLTSLFAAVPMWITSNFSFVSAKWIFVLVAALVPPATAALAHALGAKRPVALAAGLLAAFSGLYAPFLSTTDTFSLYMLFGALFFLAGGRLPDLRWAFFLGVLAALMHLSRPDGVLWLAFAGILIAITVGSRRAVFVHALVALAGYLVFMVPWLARNLTVFGTFVQPGAVKLLWLTRYDQLFAYPVGSLSFAAWKDAGLASALAVRTQSFALNLRSALGTQAGILYLPFVIVGAWRLRRDPRVRLGLIAWLTTLLVMSFVFPFAGPRGAFFHSNAATQTLFWALTPIGLEGAVGWTGRLRHWNTARAQEVFRFTLIGLAILLTGMVAYCSVIGLTWEGDSLIYQRAESLIRSSGAEPDDVVVVANPPGYFIHANRPAIALPDGDPSTLLALKRKFRARYVVLERGCVTEGLEPLYEAFPPPSGVRYIGEVGGARVFELL
jgi:hypothetical protein